MRARWIKRLLWVMLALAVMCVVAGGVLAWLGSGAAGPLAGAHIEINGDEITLARLHGGEWLAAAAGLALALLVATVVLPLALLVPLLAVALALLLVLGLLAGVAAAVMALLCSPLLVVAGLCWLTWRIARGGRRRAAQRGPDPAPSPPVP